MPVYNEEPTVYGIIKRVLAQSQVDMLLVIYDDSSDGSINEINRALSDFGKGRLMLIRSENRLGKGHAIKLGLEAAGKLFPDCIIIIQDADDEYFPEDYGKLLEKVDDSTPVFGSRQRNLGHKYFMGELATKVHTATFNLFYKQSISDINTCYKTFKLSMLKGKLPKENSWLLDMELPIMLSKNGYKIADVPVRYKGRTFKAGKKIGPKDGIKMWLYLMKPNR